MDSDSIKRDSDSKRLNRIKEETGSVEIYYRTFSTWSQSEGGMQYNQRRRWTINGCDGNENCCMHGEEAIRTLTYNTELRQCRRCLRHIQPRCPSLPSREQSTGWVKLLYNDDTCYRWVVVMNDTIRQISIEENQQSAIKFTKDVRSRSPAWLSNTQRPTPSAMSISWIQSRREVCRMNNTPRNQYKDQRYSNSPRFSYAWQRCTSDTNVGDWRESYFGHGGTWWAVTVALNLQ